MPTAGSGAVPPPDDEPTDSRDERASTLDGPSVATPPVTVPSAGAGRVGNLRRLDGIIPRSGGDIIDSEGIVMTTLRHVPRFARTESRDEPAGSPEEEARKLELPPGRRAAAKRFRELELTNWLVEARGLDPSHARAVAIRLLSSTPRIRGAFQKWWLTGRIENVEVEGYSLRRLVEEKGMSPFGALLTLSLLEAGLGVTSRELEDRARGDIDLDETLTAVGG